MAKKRAEKSFESFTSEMEYAKAKGLARVVVNLGSGWEGADWTQKAGESQPQSGSARMFSFWVPQEQEEALNFYMGNDPRLRKRIAEYIMKHGDLSEAEYSTDKIAGSIPVKEQSWNLSARTLLTPEVLGYDQL